DERPRTSSTCTWREIIGAIMYLIIGILSIILSLSTMMHSEVLQQYNDESGIILTTYIPNELANMPDGSRTSLETKLNQMVSFHGLGGNSKNPRFIITPRVNILSKEVTTTAPPMHAYSMEIVFLIGDGIEGTRYATYSVVAKGVGRS